MFFAALQFTTWAYLLAVTNVHPYFTNLERIKLERLQITETPGPVILIVVDALRPDRLNAYGFQQPTSPNLKLLADDGVLFTNYFVNANWTRPSTTSLLTGLYPAQHGVEKDKSKLSESFETLAEMLQKKGIKTAAVVGNGNASSTFGLHQGFDFYLDTKKKWQGLPRAKQVLDDAWVFVEKNSDKPFFLFVFLVDPHDPYHAPEPYETMFVSDPQVKLVRTPHWEKAQYSAAEIQRMQETYDGAVRYTDTMLGEFFDKLKAKNLYQKSNIFVTADHGEAFGEHGVFLHSHHLYDEILRAPFIYKPQDQALLASERGGFFDGLVQSVDVVPTILDLFFGSSPNYLLGTSLLKFLNHSQQANDRVIFAEFHNFGIHRLMARTATRKLILEKPAQLAEFMATIGNPSLLPSVQFEREIVRSFAIGSDAFEKQPVDAYAIKNDQNWMLLKEQLDNYNRLHRQTAEHLVQHYDPETYKNLKALGYIQ